MKHPFLCFLFWLCLFFPFYLFAEEKIIKIEVIGNDRIDKGFILNSIKTKEGDNYDIEKIRDDMKNIFKTGYFTDVQVDVKDEETGRTVTFVVVERPLIKEILIFGNKKLKTMDISEKLKIKAKTVLNIEKVKESAEEIEKLYTSKGYYPTKVSFDVTYEDYEAVVRFTIEEAQKAYVKRIFFSGNKVFKEGKLKSILKIKEKGIFSWFTGSGLLDEEVLEEDVKRVEAFYADNGYVRVRVEKPEVTISKDGKSITISFKLTEGEIYKIGEVGFSGDRIADDNYLLNIIKTKKGDIFRSSVLSEDVFRLQDLCQDQGYAFCEILPLTEIDDDSKTVDISFDVSKGEEIYVGRINISGNTKTKDKVIRRELRFAEGERFSITKFKKSKANLRNTLYFNNVDLKMTKTDQKDRIDIDVNVEEKSTGTLSLGIGYSSEERLLFTGSISQENILGTGRKVYLTAYLGSKTHEFDFTFVEPYLMDMDLSLGFNLMNYTKYFDTYDYKKQGGGLLFSRPIKEDLRSGIKYTYEKVKVFHIREEASKYVKDQRGLRTTSSVTFSLTKDTIDDKMNPTRGVYSETLLEIAGGPFGGNNYFFRPFITYGRYFPLKFMESAIFLKGSAGSIKPFGGKKIPIYEKFFLGGIDSIRGFKYGKAGKKDEEGEAIGNENEIFFNLEWIFPIFKPAGLKGVVFYDVGSGFDSMKEFELRHAAGCGIRWFSPLGPLRIELGVNLSPKKGEKRSVFDFTIGTQY